MSGLGRLLATQSMSGAMGHANAQDEWRALHRRPDALPVRDDEPGDTAGREGRRRQQLILRRLIARFGSR